MKPQQDPSFAARRVIRSYTQTIHAAPDEVHALICPVREAEWLDGWEYRMIYSESGLAEEGCVFTSRSAADPETLWVVAVRDDSRRHTRFVRITPGSRLAVVDIHVAPAAENTSHVRIVYTITALTEEGNRFVEAFTQDAFQEDMRFWEATMNHYLETGRPLPLANPKAWLHYTGNNRGPASKS
jgi:hypothetical protein